MTPLPLPQILPYQDPREPTIRGRAAAGYGHLSLAALPWDLREQQTDGAITGIKHTHTRRVVTFEEEVHATAPMRLFAKRNRARSTWRALRHRLFGSKARREWATGWALTRCGVLTGRPVIVAERREGGLVRENFLVTEAISAERTLRDHLALASERGDDPTPLLAPLAAFVRDLHSMRFHHDDLSADHLWIDTRGDATRFGVIDLDGSRFRRRLSARHRTMNLFQILRSIPPRLLSAAQREAFLAAFHGERWHSVRDRVTADLQRIEARKESRDVLG